MLKHKDITFFFAVQFIAENIDNQLNWKRFIVFSMMILFIHFFWINSLSSSTLKKKKFQEKVWRNSFESKSPKRWWCWKKNYKRQSKILLFVDKNSFDHDDDDKKKKKIHHEIRSTNKQNKTAGKKQLFLIFRQMIKSEPFW